MVKANMFVALFLMVAVGSEAMANRAYSRDDWKSWRGRWSGDFWQGGNFGNTQYMTCVGVDGSDGGPEFWSEGYGEDAARRAYQSTLDWVNVADRNMAYIEVECGY